MWLDEAQEKAANIALNKLSGEFDLPALKDLIEELDTGEIDLDITGFGQEDIAQLMEQIPPDPNFAPGCEEEQGQLDEKTPIVCPNCKHEFIHGN